MQQQYLPRNTLIKLIHTGQRALALDDATYRDMLETATGLRSCGDKKMTPKKLTAVLARMRELGFEPADKPAQNPARKSALAKPGQIGIVRALWQRMHAFAIVHDPSDRALDAYCKRMTGNTLGFCTVTECQRLIECLKKWWQRAATPAQIAALESLLGEPEPGHVLQ